MNVSWHILWEFRIAEEHREAFEKAYGAEGDWAKLFRRSSAFRGTTLLRDPAIRGRFLTVDEWDDSAAFAEFKLQYASEYKALDVSCEALTEYELKIGAFEVIAP